MSDKEMNEALDLIKLLKVILRDVKSDEINDKLIALKNAIVAEYVKDA